MIGNSDIFDKDELLAIANDDDGSSLSSHSSIASEEDVSKKAWGSEVKDETEKEGAAAEIDDVRKEKNDTSSSKPQAAPIMNAKGIEKDGSSSDDDRDDDGGFLESWFDRERKKSTAAESKQLDAEIEESTTENANKPENTDKKENDIDRSDDKNTIKLGASVLKWISSAKRSGGNKSSQPGIVAIQHNCGDQDMSERSSLLRVDNTTANRRKRLRAGRGDSMEATLEDMTGNSASERMAHCGQAVSALANAGRKSAAGAMLDCIARYDPQKGCYVLDIVDLLVSKLEPSSKEARKEQTVAHQENATADANTIPTSSYAGKPAGLLDPLSVKKRAEDQIKKLKKGKGRVTQIEKRKQKVSKEQLC